MKGVYLGRKQTIDVKQVQRLKAEGLGATAIALQMDIDRTSVYRIL
ncbi:MAG: helix-turn-helix domain-containing protein [Hyphomicrobiales bacterium]